MHLLDLDEYSLGVILSFLDPESHISTMYTCKSLHRLCVAATVNQPAWFAYISGRVIAAMSYAVKKRRQSEDDWFGVDVHKDKKLNSILAILIGYLQSTDLITFLQNYEFIFDKSDDKMCQLLLHSAKSKSLHFDCIMRSYHPVSRWITFDNCGGKTLVVSSVPPDSDCRPGQKEICFFLIDNTSSQVEHHHFINEEWFNFITEDFVQSRGRGQSVRTACEELSHNLFGNRKAISCNTLVALVESDLPSITLKDSHEGEKLRRSSRGKRKPELINNIKKVFQRDVDSLVAQFEPSDFTRCLEELLRALKVFSALIKPSDRDAERMFFRKLTSSLQPFTDVLFYTQDVKYYPVMRALLGSIDVAKSCIGDVEASQREIIFRMGHDTMTVFKDDDDICVKINDQPVFATDFCAHCMDPIEVKMCNEMLAMVNLYLLPSLEDEPDTSPSELMEIGSFGAVVTHLLGCA